MITASPATLTAILASTLPFASSDRSLPVLNAVNLTYLPAAGGAAGGILARATDRYVLGVARAADITASEFEPFNIPAADAKALIAMCKPHLALPYACVTLTEETPGREGGAWMAHVVANGGGATIASCRFESTFGEFPKVGRLFGDLFPTDGALGDGAVAQTVDASKLAQVTTSAKAVAASSTLRKATPRVRLYQASTVKPTTFVIDADDAAVTVLGLVMPIRSTADPLDPWRGIAL